MCNARVMMHRGIRTGRRSRRWRWTRWRLCRSGGTRRTGAALESSATGRKDGDGRQRCDESTKDDDTRPICLYVLVQIIRNARIYNVEEIQSCMVSTLRIIRKQTVANGRRWIEYVGQLGWLMNGTWYYTTLAYSPCWQSTLACHAFLSCCAQCAPVSLSAGTPPQKKENAQASSSTVRVRFHIIRNARIENVGKSQSCMVSKLRIIWKQTVGVASGISQKLSVLSTLAASMAM